MILYDKGKWYSISLSYQGTVIGKMMVRIIGLLLITVMLAVLQQHGYAIPAVNSTLHTLLGTGLSLLLVFRTNSSYDRYWEGRKLLGAIVNNNRSFFRNITTAFRGRPEDAAVLVQYVSGFVTGLKHTLRQDKDTREYAEYLKVPEDLERVSKFHNPATASLVMMTKWVHEQIRKGALERWEGRSLEAYIGGLGDSQGGLERIANTPIPFAYAAQTHQFLLLYLITLPFTMVTTYQYYALVAVFIISFGLIGVDEAGVEIEDPFGHDDNDLPLEGIFGTIMRDAKGITEFFGEVELGKPAIAEMEVHREGSGLIVHVKDDQGDDPE